MYFKVQSFFTTHAGEFTGAVPALSGQLTLFNSQLAAMENVVGIASENNQGYTLQKQKNREAMRNAALEMTGALKAYALQSSNVILAGKVDFNKSGLDGMRDTEVLFTCSRLYDIAVENQSDLINFGITPTQILQFQKSVDAFRTSMQTPAEQRSEAKAANQQLIAEIDKTDSLLLIIDNLMETQRFSKELLYNQYRADRLIDDNASGQSDPDVEMNLMPGTTKVLYQAAYSATRRFRLVNNNANLRWGLSQHENTFSGTSFDLTPNSISTRLSSSLGLEGEYLLIQNFGTEDAEVTLYVE